MSKVIKRLNAYGMGGTFDQPGYEYDPVNDTFKDLETGKVFSKDYVAPTSGTGTGTSTVKLETNKEVSITTNGEIEITPTLGKDAMEKVTANVAVPVPVLETNKATTIDVSQYTEPVEIIPTNGKDAMEKITVTLDNIPSSGATLQLYAWKNSDNDIAYTLSPNPQNGELAFYNFDLATKETNQSFDISNTDGSSYINWDDSNFQRDSSLDTSISGPCLLDIYGNSVLPVGQVLYGGSGYNLSTDGTSSVIELFNTASFSPTYTGTVGNVHFFYPYSG